MGNSLQIVEETYDLQTNTVNVTLEIVGHANNFDIIEVTNQLTVVEGDSTLELVPEAFVLNRTFSGEGAVADQDTIVGDGTQFDPLRAPDMLRVSLKLGEFSTAAEKQEAITNLGLHIIDGGTFTY